MNIFDQYLDRIKKTLFDLSKNGNLILPENLDTITAEIPPSKFNSDISTNVAMVLSKVNKKAPIELANTLAEAIKENDKEPLYLGFFHTGAYQDAISGYGGIKHCLIPSPKHVIISKDEDGNLIDYVYRNEQSAEEMFKLLGYK